MSKIVVKPNKQEDLNEILKLNIDGVILPLENLAVFSSCFLSLKDIINLKTNKEKIVLINKVIHNSDLPLLRETLIKLENSDITKIMFYDLSILSLAKELNLTKELVIYQEHLNRSINSNKFYNTQGINYSYISSDITKEEIEQIKKNTNMKLFYLSYGRMPLFCSRRYLLTNYLKYIGKSKKNLDYFIQDKDNTLYISEEKNATIIYSDIINLINQIDELDFIDYLVLDFNNIKSSYEVISTFLNKTKDRKEYYLGFYNTKTIFKVK